MLNILADAHQLAREPELLLDCVPGGDRSRRAICAQQVPCVEAGEVLEGSQELVAAYGCGDEFEVPGNRGVVDQAISDHVGGVKGGRMDEGAWR